MIELTEDQLMILGGEIVSALGMRPVNFRDTPSKYNIYSHKLELATHADIARIVLEIVEKFK